VPLDLMWFSVLSQADDW